MPSIPHDLLNALFRSRPEFAVEILRDIFEVDLPAGAGAAVVPGDFNDRPSRDFQADTVIIVGSRHEPLHGIIVEIQLKPDDHKRLSFPRYAAALWLRLSCPISVLVLCPDTKVAAWAARPIPTTLPGYTLYPKVFGPDQTPPITDPGEAVTHPELAIVSLMAHGLRRD